MVGGVVANALGTGDVFELNFPRIRRRHRRRMALIVVGERVGMLTKFSSSG